MPAGTDVGNNIIFVRNVFVYLCLLIIRYNQNDVIVEVNPSLNVLKGVEELLRAAKIVNSRSSKTV